MTPHLPDHYLRILRFVADGNTNAQVAAKTRMSESAVKESLRTLCRQLRARDRAHLVHIAWQAGVLAPSGARLHLDHLPAADPPLERLVAAREAAGLHQAEVAARLGVSRTSVSHWETRRTPMRIGMVRRYAELVGVDVDGDGVELPDRAVGEAA